MIDEVSQVGVPLNTAAGQKASLDSNSGPFSSSFTANAPPSNAFASHGFDSVTAATDTTAQTFTASTTNAFAKPVNVFTPLSSFGQSAAVPQQGSGGFASSLSQPQTMFGFAQPARIDASQSHTADITASLVYTPLDQLTAEEKAQYEASKFTLGRIPVRPPPKELV